MRIELDLIQTVLITCSHMMISWDPEYKAKRTVLAHSVYGRKCGPYRYTSEHRRSSDWKFSRPSFNFPVSVQALTIMGKRTVQVPVSPRYFTGKREFRYLLLLDV